MEDQHMSSDDSKPRNWLAMAGGILVLFGAAASGQGVRGWVRVQSSAPTPDSLFSFNSSGAANSVSRTVTGQYTVSFPNLGASNGTVEVSAYGSPSRCKVASWSPSG